VYVVEMTFNILDKKNLDEEDDAINDLFGSLRMNGQILGREYPVCQTKGSIIGYVLCPERDSLKGPNNNKYVNSHIKKLKEHGLSKPKIRVLGQEMNPLVVDACSEVKWYILHTPYASLTPPLWCGEHYESIPLYRLPKTYDDEYYDIMCWQTDWQACDDLQMNCSTGERFGTKNISDINSSLSKQGIDICKRIKKLTGKPIYYYLYRYGGRSLKAELDRRCPKCNGKWLLKEPLHDRFDFKCDKCHLLSNISWAYRHKTNQ